MKQFYVPRLIKALNAELPSGYWAHLERAEDESTDDSIQIMHDKDETPVHIQLGLDAMCTVNIWNEAEGSMLFGIARPITAIAALVADVKSQITA